MPKIHPGRGSPTALVLIAVVALCVGGYAIAASSSSTKKIQACANKRTGALRLAKKSGRCKHGERKVAWNRAGTKGSTGGTGPPGTPGTPGAPGPAAVPVRTALTPVAGQQYVTILQTGGLTVEGACLALGGNSVGLTMRASSSASGTLEVAGSYISTINLNDHPAMPSTGFFEHRDLLVGASPINTPISSISVNGVVRYQLSMTYIDPSSVITSQLFVQLDSRIAAPGPGCKFYGTAVTAPS